MMDGSFAPMYIKYKTASQRNWSHWKSDNIAPEKAIRH